MARASGNLAQGMLAGYTVLDFTQIVAGPTTTRLMAEMGAEVIKIERPEGDFARGYDDVAKGQSSYFVWLNRGKQSRTLDLTTDDGKSELARLLSEADIIRTILTDDNRDRAVFDIKVRPCTLLPRDW